MKRKGRQLYMADEVWELVESEAKKQGKYGISVNKWIETHFLGYFLSKQIKEKK